MTEEDVKKARKAAKWLAPMFACNHWEWAGVGVPTEADLFEHIVEYMRFMTESEQTEKMESGRVAVEADRGEGGKEPPWFEIYLAVPVGY